MKKGIIEFEHIGICGNLDALMPADFNCYKFVAEFSQGWKKHSGNMSEPINDYEVDDKWKNPDRIELCDFLIDKVELILDSFDDYGE